MKLLHLIPQLRLGAGRYVVDLAARQARSGRWRTVDVLVSDDAEPPFASDGRLRDELSASGVGGGAAGDFFHRVLPGLTQAARRVRAAAGGGPWVAHAHTAMAAAVASLAGARTIVGTCHGVAAGRDAAFDVQDAVAWRLCDAVTTPSAHWADRLRAQFGVDAAVVIPVGLDLSRYPRRARREPRAVQRILCVAELTARKGVDLLLEALPRVWSVHPGVECHVFGNGDAADALRRAGARVDPAGRRLRFLGHVVRPYDRLGEYDLFVLPSRSDNQPVAVIEAQLAGLPVVVTDVGGMPELARDPVRGWVTPAEDPPALAAALVEACMLDAAALAALGDIAQDEARERFDIAATARRLDAVYDSALARAEPAGLRS